MTTHHWAFVNVLAAHQHTTNSPTEHYFAVTTSAALCVSAISAFIIFNAEDAEKRKAKTTTEF
ncbi:hypothetical protein SH528x_007358 [Novipirellula sp. SH528]|uniref:hypothetical protein n=1 Tax=Novipirellula sp. SH528 TaxID=3454466 RepID=UPI003FA01656